MRHRFAMLLCFATGVLSSGCSSGLGVVVTSIADPDASLTSVRAYELVTTDGNDLLVEKNLLRMVDTELRARGYVRDAQSPDVLVAVLGDIDSQREYVPPDTAYTPYYEPGDSYTITSKRRVNGQVVRSRRQVRVPGDWVYVPQVRPGYERIVFQKSITIRLLDADPSRAGDPVPVDDEILGGASATDSDAFNAVPVWEGRVSTIGSEPDLLALAPLMIREALGEFPAPSGKPSRRTVERAQD